ncbi:hypothetical protein HID58_034681, partial [Brassica napus]
TKGKKSRLSLSFSSSMSSTLRVRFCRNLQSLMMFDPLVRRRFCRNLPSSSTNCRRLSVAYHIVPQRLSFTDLRLLQPLSRLPTLLAGNLIVGTNNSVSVSSSYSKRVLHYCSSHKWVLNTVASTSLLRGSMRQHGFTQLYIRERSFEAAQQRSKRLMSCDRRRQVVVLCNMLYCLSHWRK